MPCISLIHVHLFTFSMASSKVLPLPVSILDESHAELVDTHLGRQPGEPRPSENLYHCVTDEKGRPVSWVLSDELCELKMAYTLLEYRRAGHLVAMSLALVRRMSSVGLPIYCHVHQQNQATSNAVTWL